MRSESRANGGYASHCISFLSLLHIRHTSAVRSVHGRVISFTVRPAMGAETFVSLPCVTYANGLAPQRRFVSRSLRHTRGTNADPPIGQNLLSILPHSEKLAQLVWVQCRS
jgi:hypothetical protein